MTVRNGALLGHLYVKNGELIDAAFREQDSLEAAYTILNWARPEIEFVDTCRVERTLDVPLTEILLNAAMLKDMEGHDS
jgi:hypothetical protein